MRILSYRVIIQKDGDGYHGSVPALPGCHTFGESIEDVRRNVKEAITGWIETTKSQGWDVPEDETIETLETVEVNLPKLILKTPSYA
jgi:antitoxin HicB